MKSNPTDKRINEHYEEHGDCPVTVTLTYAEVSLVGGMLLHHMDRLTFLSPDFMEVNAIVDKFSKACAAVPAIAADLSSDDEWAEEIENV